MQFSRNLSLVFRIFRQVVFSSLFFQCYLACPSSFNEISYSGQSSCYHVASDAQKNWNDAKTFCEAKESSQLMYFEDINEMKALGDLISNMGKVGEELLTGACWSKADDPNKKRFKWETGDQSMYFPILIATIT